jgi:hypothetical protein
LEIDENIQLIKVEEPQLWLRIVMIVARVMCFFLEGALAYL